MLFIFHFAPTSPDLLFGSERPNTEPGVLVETGR